MKTSRMLLLFGAALLALTTARCNCGQGPPESNSMHCPTIGEFRCNPDNQVLQYCFNFLGTGEWTPFPCTQFVKCPGSTICQPGPVEGTCYCPVHDS